MRIVVSLLNFRPGRIGGGTETLLRNLIPELAAIKGDDTIVAVTYRDIADEITTPGLERVVVDKSGPQIILERCLEAFTPYRAFSIERVFREVEPDVILFPQQSMFPKTPAAPAVLTVLDLQHLSFPQYFPLFDTYFRKAIYGYSLERAECLIAISDFTRMELIDLCGVASEKVVAIPLGYSPPDVSETEVSELVTGPYLYYPAASFPHKGHAVLLRTFAHLKNTIADFDYKIVFTGQRTGYWKHLEKQIRETGIGNLVIHLGFVSFEEVNRLYRGAEAVLFPTEYEGFGLPVVESATFGKKTIASKLPVFDEIGLPKHYQIDFSDPKQFLEALRSDLPIELEKEVWTWARNAEETLAVFRSVGRGT